MLSEDTVVTVHFDCDLEYEVDAEISGFYFCPDSLYECDSGAQLLDQGFPRAHLIHSPIFSLACIFPCKITLHIYFLKSSQISLKGQYSIDKNIYFTPI